MQCWAAPDWSAEIVYFVLVDRFADGDPANNARVERGNPGGYHGGDLKGLTEQLDELEDLGVTALWISPVQRQMTEGLYAQAPPKLKIPEFKHWGFHGYWIDDFTAMEPQFGTIDELKNLVDAAHKRGIKVLLDVVYNHPGYLSTYQGRKAESGESWIRVGEGNCEVDAIKCRVGGLPDFRTELPEVRQYLLKANIDLAKRTGMDGFRLDTYKHVETEFWLEHRKLTREQLGSGFFLLAEYWGGTAASLDRFFSRDEIDGGFDFSFKGSCESFVLGRGRAVAFGSYLGSRHQVRPGYLLAHYLSSHDEPMALGNLEGDKDQVFASALRSRWLRLECRSSITAKRSARGGTSGRSTATTCRGASRDILPGKGIARDEAMRELLQEADPRSHASIRRCAAATTRC